MLPFANERALIIIDSLAHRGPEDGPVKFFPYDLEFDDNFKPEWNEHDAFGRMDPVMIYKRTTRDINVNFNVVAEDAQTAQNNFLNLTQLLKYIYPVYDTPNVIIQQSVSDNFVEAQTLAETQKIQNSITEQQTIKDFGINVIKKSPLFTISFMNLLDNTQYVCAMTNFKHKFKFDAGGSSFNVDGDMIPGEFSLNIGFKVIHTYIPGTRSNYFKHFHDEIGNL